MHKHKHNSVLIPALSAVVAAVITTHVSVVFASVSTFADGIVVGGTTLAEGLLLDIDGAIGANNFCDAAGGSCFEYSDLAGIGGSGTAGYLVKFASSSSVTNSIIQDDGSNIGVGRTPGQKLDVDGNIVVRGGTMFFQGLNQTMYGDGDSYLYFDSNDATDAQIILRDAGNTVLGSLFGDDSGNFGLLDADGDWAIKHDTDTNTIWNINAVEQMRLTATGLKIGSGNATTTLDVDGDAYFNGDITLVDDADIYGVDIIQGFNDLRFQGDDTGGVDLQIAADGKIGIGGPGSSTGLNILSSNCSEADLTGDAGCIMLGNVDNTNIAIDTNEIQARNNGANSVLIIQPEGGSVYTGALDVTSSLYVRGDNQQFEIRPGYRGGSVNSSYTTFEMDGTDTLYVWDNLEINDDLILNGNDFVMVQNDTFFKFDNGEWAFRADSDAEFAAYYNGNIRLQTQSYGIQVIGGQLRVTQLCDYDASHCVNVDAMINALGNY